MSGQTSEAIRETGSAEALSFCSSHSLTPGKLKNFEFHIVNEPNKPQSQQQ
ncbi:MAG: hypothetical protein PVG66_06935 [Chromatiales bacterium]|jgi:hypothetical protein